MYSESAHYFTKPLHTLATTASQRESESAQLHCIDEEKEQTNPLIEESLTRFATSAQPLP
jgi:hypothetical protein